MHDTYWYSEHPDGFTVVTKEIPELAIKHYLKHFFADKGIPENELCTPRHIDFVRWVELGDAINIAHLVLEENRHGEDTPDPFETRRIFIVSILDGQIAKKRIPKEHAGGILLVFLHLCMGYKLY